MLLNYLLAPFTKKPSNQQADPQNNSNNHYQQPQVNHQQNNIKQNSYSPQSQEKFNKQQSQYQNKPNEKKILNIQSNYQKKNSSLQDIQNQHLNINKYSKSPPKNYQSQEEDGQVSFDEEKTFENHHNNYKNSNKQVQLNGKNGQNKRKNQNKETPPKQKKIKINQNKEERIIVSNQPPKIQTQNQDYENRFPKDQSPSPKKITKKQPLREKPKENNEDMRPILTNEMCTPSNFRDRNQWNQGDKTFEYDPMQRRFCMEKAILPFKRSAEGNFDKELRSIEGLEKSIRHLSNEIIDLDNFPNVHYQKQEGKITYLDIHEFVIDRMQAIQNDFSKHIDGSQRFLESKSSCLEKLILFNIISQLELINMKNIIQLELIHTKNQIQDETRYKLVRSKLEASQKFTADYLETLVIDYYMDFLEELQKFYQTIQKSKKIQTLSSIDEIQQFKLLYLRFNKKFNCKQIQNYNT